MGLHTGKASLCRYRVLGLKKKTSLAEIGDNLEPFKAKKIRLSGGLSPESCGWVRPVGLDQEILSDSDHWDLTDCRFGEGLIMRCRIENKKVPARLLQSVVRERVVKKNARRNKPMSAKERRQVLQETKTELLESALPNISYADLYWNLASGELLFFANTKKPRELFEQLFYKTFCENLGLCLVKLDPPLQALTKEDWDHKDLSSPVLSTLLETVPSPFYEQVH